MSASLVLPYFPPPELRIGSIGIAPFAVLVAVAVLVGVFTTLRRTRRFGVPAEEIFQLCFWLLVSGFAGAYLAKIAMADPGVLGGRGIRSVGGIIGGFCGGLVWCRLRRLSLYETIRRLDIVVYGIPFAWMFGRLGCALVHDHRGLASESWVAVQFPDGPRYDLGVIEFFFLIVLSAWFAWLDRRPRPVGFYFTIYPIVYGGFRIWLDTLHIQPYRFYGGAFGVFVGLLGWWFMRRWRAPAV